MFSTRFLSAFALLSLLGVNASEGSGQNSRFFKRQNTDCISPDPQNTIADRINAILNAPNAAGVSVKLCPNTEYLILSPLKFGQPKQEIITLGFPSPTMNMTSRAIIKVGGPVANGEGHTIAIDGTCPTCDGVALRYVQIDGDRDDAPPTKGGANIEMGGDNEGQIIEGVRSFNPRSWSCLHLAEGPLSCSGALIQNNDIGPCGQDSFQQWADGISLSCKNSIVRNNYITGATDGGIVIFGSPGSHVYNNTIECKGAMLLGGINLVDYDPWKGDYTGVVVENNTILGGFATNVSAPGAASPDDPPGELELGWNNETAFIKIGIAMGPRTWFGDKFGMSMTFGAVVRNNLFQGAFGYAMAAATVTNYTITGNIIGEDTTFIGSVGPNCSTTDVTPDPTAFVMNSTQVVSSQLQSEFVDRDSDSLICILPDNGDFWPWAPGKSPEDLAHDSAGKSGSNDPTGQSNSNDSAGKSSSKVGLAVGMTVAIIAAMAIAFFLHKWYMKRTRHTRQLY